MFKRKRILNWCIGVLLFARYSLKHFDFDFVFRFKINVYCTFYHIKLQ